MSKQWDGSPYITLRRMTPSEVEEARRDGTMESTKPWERRVEWASYWLFAIGAGWYPCIIVEGCPSFFAWPLTVCLICIGVCKDDLTLP